MCTLKYSENFFAFTNYKFFSVGKKGNTAKYKSIKITQNKISPKNFCKQ